jgi:hypothetical protein
MEPLDPAAFSGWWVAGGVILAVAAAALLVGPWLWRRLARRRTAPDNDADRQSGTVDLGAAALAEIDRIEAAWTAGELTDRAAAQGIAAAVKSLAGTDAATLTLLDLRFRGDVPVLVEVIEAAYPVEFGVKGEGDVAALARQARGAVAL